MFIDMLSWKPACSTKWWRILVILRIQFCASAILFYTMRRLFTNRTDVCCFLSSWYVMGKWMSFLSEYAISLLILTLFPVTILGLTLYRVLVLIGSKNNFRRSINERSLTGLILYESESLTNSGPLRITSLMTTFSSLHVVSIISACYCLIIDRRLLVEYVFLDFLTSYSLWWELFSPIWSLVLYYGSRYFRQHQSVIQLLQCLD